jgi:hypothetical protein
MTGLGVDRTPCTSYPVPRMSSTGASVPLPSPSQEAERRTERHPRRTGYARWGLRVLVVGGLAGAAWLLTGAAAQAADRADVPVGTLLGSALDGSIVDGSASNGSSADDRSFLDLGTTAPVRGVLKAATQPLEAARPAGTHQVVDDIIDVPRRVLTRPAETLGELVNGSSGTPADAVTGGVDQVMRGVADPIRLTGGPADTQQRRTAVTDEAVATMPPPAASPSSTSALVPTPDAEQLPVHMRLLIPAHHAKAHSTRSSVRHRTTTAHAVTVEPETATMEDTPGGDDPAAPLRLHLGDVSGSPTTGSGTRTEGGSAAFLPAAIASSTTAWHPLPIASDVEVRRHDAEAPTVSPD